MSDMYGAVKSNHFRVRDAEAFKKWFAGYTFGEVEIWVDPAGGVNDVLVSFGGYVQYPSAYPQVHNNLDEDEDADPVEEAELELFADELRQHLMPGELFYVVAGGAEALRYVGFQELAISHEGVGYRMAFSDDDEAGRQLIGIAPQSQEQTVGPKINDPPRRKLDLGDD